MIRVGGFVAAPQPAHGCGAALPLSQQLREEDTVPRANVGSAQRWPVLIVRHVRLLARPLLDYRKDALCAHAQDAQLDHMPPMPWKLGTSLSEGTPSIPCTYKDELAYNLVHMAVNTVVEKYTSPRDCTSEPSWNSTAATCRLPSTGDSYGRDGLPAPGAAKCRIHCQRTSLTPTLSGQR